MFLGSGFPCVFDMVWTFLHLRFLTVGSFSEKGEEKATSLFKTLSNNPCLFFFSPPLLWTLSIPLVS